jgi:hypothetical protein
MKDTTTALPQAIVVAVAMLTSSIEEQSPTELYN